MFDVPDGAKTYIPDPLLELQQLGAAGKLWTLEIEFEIGNGEYRLARYRNLTDEEMMVKRNKMFMFGLTLKVKGVAGSWQIIMPKDIKGAFVHQQSGYFSG